MAARCGNPGARILHAVGLVGAVRDEIDAELALGRFHRRVNLALGHAEAFGIELEVMDQRFHRGLHLGPARRRDLMVLRQHRPLACGEFSRSMHCFMMRTDWRISSMRIR